MYYSEGEEPPPPPPPPLVPPHAIAPWLAVLFLVTQSFLTTIHNWEKGSLSIIPTWKMTLVSSRLPLGVINIFNPDVYHSVGEEPPPPPPYPSPCHCSITGWLAVFLVTQSFYFVRILQDKCMLICAFMLNFDTYKFPHSQLNIRRISSAESQKGINSLQRCSVENQKGAITKDFVQRYHPSGFQQNIFERH